MNAVNSVVILFFKEIFLDFSVFFCYMYNNEMSVQIYEHIKYTWLPYVYKKAVHIHVAIQYHSFSMVSKQSVSYGTFSFQNDNEFNINMTVRCTLKPNLLKHILLNLRKGFSNHFS